MRFALIGCGAMGKEIAQAFAQDEIAGPLSAVYDVDTDSAKAVAAIIQSKGKDCVVAATLEELIQCCDVVIEAASQKAVREYANTVLTEGKDILIMSVGALMDQKLYGELVATAEKNGASVYLPAGALAGIDAVLAASRADVEEVVITSTKPPAGLAGVAYIAEQGIDLDEITQATVVFEGKASEAAKLFPKNINVAAILSLAAGREASVKIVADPNAERNSHEICARGSFGEIKAKTENVPSPTNPKTSYLAILAAIATLKKITEPVKKGT